jgi:transcriptional regulator with XRE-family HTH domain
MTGEEFRKIRKAARMTQAQMAERLGKTRKTIVNWETGVFSIPEGALDTLTETGIAPEPAASAPVTFVTHPELFTAGNGAARKYIRRNHKHPHWWTSALRNYMTPEQQNITENIRTTTDDLAIEWTSERAIVFTMQFVNKTREEAEDICRSAGFDIARTKKLEFIAAHNEWLTAHGSLAGFYDAYPQYDDRPKPAGEIDPKLKEAFDNAFKL